jgi:O-antigen ligase
MVISQTVAMPRPWIERLAAGFLSAVVICRLLTPTDGAATGETVWIAQFSLLGLLVWACAAYRSNHVLLRFNRVDAAVGLLCLGHVIGALVVVSTSGDKRAAMTMLWEWVGIAVTWFLMRTQLVSAADRKGMLIVVAAAAVSLSGLGIWQHHFGYGESRRTYEKLKAESESLARSGRPADPQRALEWDRAMHVVRSEFVRQDIPVEDSARILWEQRLYSGEPIGMFALTNTLAGVLVCAGILWLGILACARRSVPAWRLPLGAILTTLILYCLLLTKSRTAFVGLASGLILWGAVGLGFRRAGLRRIWPGLAAGMAILVLLVGIAAATGGLDQLVISESTKSLRYRFEYWTSTWQMLMETPRNWLLGVGPGNFRQNYLQFKLPQSSEEIADPHNLVLDVWANGGLLALAGLAGICFAGLRPLISALKSEVSRSRQTSDIQETEHDAGPTWRDGILAGAVLGHLVVLFLGLGSEETLVLLLLGWWLVALTGSSLFRNEPASGVYAAAFAALVVHLLGAGGIGMPAITQMLLLFVALSDGDESAAGWTWEPERRMARRTICGVALALFLGCLFTGLNPILNARVSVAAGIEELFERGNLSKAEREFGHAVEADPWSSIPYERLSEMAYQRWLGSDKDRSEEFKRSVDWQQQAIARDPRHAGGYRTLAEMYIARFKRTGEQADAAAAADAMLQAVALYPNHALGQSQLAEALALAGRQDEARLAARRALGLEAINERAGHIDKRLPKGRLELMKQILGDSRQPAAGISRILAGGNVERADNRDGIEPSPGPPRAAIPEPN